MTTAYREFLKSTKLPAFRKSMKAIYEELVSLDWCSQFEKINFNSIDREQAQFPIRKTFERPDLLGDPLITHKLFLSVIDSMNDMFVTLGCEPVVTSELILNAMDDVISAKSKWGGYDVSLTFTQRHEWKEIVRIFGVMTIKGKEIKEKPLKEESFPKIKVGEIFESCIGVTMDIAKFFKVKRRSGNTVYCVELYREATEGQLGYMGMCVPVEKEMDVIYKATIKDDNTISLSYHFGRKVNSYRWDGKPSFFNYID